MLRRLLRIVRAHEDGQALVLFAAGLLAFLGLVGMSIDVGRLVWARTSIQAGVDASALAAAQSMPDASGATAKATEYWLKDSKFIQAQGNNIHYSVTFPPGNKALAVHADAEVSTWFVRLFGIDHWNVSADGEAASQVLDISLVLDISQSMCDDTYPRVDQRPNMGPGHGTVPTITQKVNPGDTVIHVSDTAPFTAPLSNYMTGGYSYGLKPQGGLYPAWNTVSPTGSKNSDKTTPYWMAAPILSYGGKNFPARPGLIMLAIPAGPGTQATGELMQIIGVNAAAKTITVARGVNDKRGSQVDPAYPGVPTTATVHAVGDPIWMDFEGNGCGGAAQSNSGPFQPYDETIVDSQYFTTLFNSGYDRIGLAHFSSTATLDSGLTSNFSTITSKLSGMAKPAGGTNTAHGIAVGRQIVDGAGKRGNAVRVIVLITDGRAKEYCGATYNASNYDNTSCPSAGGGTEGNYAANHSAEQEAIRAFTEAKVGGAYGPIKIYVIGLGAGTDSDWLKLIADGGTPGACVAGKPECTYFDAPTTSQLNDAFRTIAAQTHITLTK